MENPVDKYAVSDAWSRGNEYRTPFDYTIENSQQTVLIRRLDMADLLKLGIAEQMDFMSKSLMAEDKPGETKQDTQQAISDAVLKSGNFAQMEAMVNAVCMAGVIKPKLHKVPVHDAARQLGLTYIDSVPFVDRMELFSVIYDAEGLAAFRPKQADGVGDVADVTDVPLPADRPVDVRPVDTEGVLLQPGSVPVGPDGGIGDEQSGTDEPPSEDSGTGNGRVSEHGEVGSPEPVSGN